MPSYYARNILDMNYKVSFILLMGLLPALSVSAQRKVVRDSTIQDQTIQITQIYKPEIARPQKPELTPVLPRVDTTKPVFQYVVPQQTLSYTYHSVPIRPLALGRQQTEASFPNYIKAGLGNLSSIYVDAGIGGLTGTHYESDFHFSHLSQKGKLMNQQSSSTALDASGKYFTDNYSLGAALHIFHRGNTFYGYDTMLYDYGKNNLKQAFTGGRLTLSGTNLHQNKWNIWYYPEITFGIYSDLFSGRERSLAFNIPAKLVLDEQSSFTLGISGNLVQFKSSLSTNGNNLFQINPAFDLQLKRTRIHVGISPAFGRDDITYFLPDLNLESHLLDNHLTFVLGWKGKIVQNTFEELSTKNPFMDNIYIQKQTKADQVFGGIESAVGDHFSFGATLSWRQWKNLAMFINDYLENPDGKRFQVVYDSKVQALSLDAFASYQVGQTIRLSAGGSWYNFYQTTTYDKVWQEPMLRLNGTVEVHPLKKLYARAALDFWDGMYAFQQNGKADKLPAFLDLGLSGEYNFIPRFSLFLQLNNILNSRYQRWNQYDNYGFNIIGGFRFKF